MLDFGWLGSASLWKSGPLFSTGTKEAELMVRELRVEPAVAGGAIGGGPPWAVKQERGKRSLPPRCPQPLRSRAPSPPQAPPPPSPPPPPPPPHAHTHDPITESAQ